ncbi:MAG: CocE/NonD family hydrolase [Halioglobus sp.]
MKNIAKIPTLLGFSIVCVIVAAYYKPETAIRVILGLPSFEMELGNSSSLQLEMHDGVRLNTNIYLPHGEGPWPAILIRDPYDYFALLCKMLSRYGYACVHQDVRGRYDSTGDWYPVINERQDGLDTLDWLVKQEWQNDNIATLGASYVGLVQWAMIDEMPEQVKTVVADFSHGDWYEIVQKNGHFVKGS